MHRDPLQVVLSMKKNGMQPFDDDVDAAVAILRERYEAFKRTVTARNISFVELKHADFLDDRDGTLGKLKELSKLKLVPFHKAISYYGMSGDTPESVWDNWFDRSKVTNYS